MALDALLDGFLESLQFAGAEYFGMARQHLFHQRRPGAGHADNKDRRPRPVAAARSGLHEIRRENGPDVLEHPQSLRLVIIDGAPFQGIALQEMPEAILVLADIIEG